TTPPRRLTLRDSAPRAAGPSPATPGGAHYRPAGGRNPPRPPSVGHREEVQHPAADVPKAHEERRELKAHHEKGRRGEPGPAALTAADERHGALPGAAQRRSGRERRQRSDDRAPHQVDRIVEPEVYPDERDEDQPDHADDAEPGVEPPD